MTGYTLILIAKMQAEATLAEPRLAYARNMLRAIARDIETPALPRHIVERGLESMDALFNVLVKHGGLVK